MKDSHPPATTLEALRASGAWRRDPARFRALEALARRLPGQAPPVRRLLEEKLQAALAAYAAQVQEGLPVHRPRPADANAPASPLARLNRELRARRAGDDPAPEELASVRGFRRAWSRVRTLDQVEQAVARKPANPGPLNSHALVVQSLETLRTLSPDYLRAFVGYVETLQWLEEAGKAPRDAAAPNKAAKTPRRGKARG